MEHDRSPVPYTAQPSGPPELEPKIGGDALPTAPSSPRTAQIGDDESPHMLPCEIPKNLPFQPSFASYPTPPTSSLSLARGGSDNELAEGVSPAARSHFTSRQDGSDDAILSPSCPHPTTIAKKVSECTTLLQNQSPLPHTPVTRSQEGNQSTSGAPHTLSTERPERVTPSAEGGNLLNGLSNRNPNHRLGALHPTAELTAHLHIADINWDAFKSRLASELDVSNPDPEFTNAFNGAASLNEEDLCENAAREEREEARREEWKARREERKAREDARREERKARREARREREVNREARREAKRKTKKANGAWKTPKEKGTVLSGGTDRHLTYTTKGELPIIIGTTNVTATPDTGSDGNAMTEKMARSLGLQIEEDTTGGSFVLANGQRITSKGSASTQCSFAGDVARQLFSIVFNIFTNLAVPVVVGRTFLEATETMTKHSNRLKVSAQSSLPSFRRILHLNRPRKTLRCYLNSKEVNAYADTGAEMNLASAQFVDREHISIGELDPQHQRIILADGSWATLIGQFSANFDTFQKPSKNTLRPRPHQKTFYVLDGLTTDILLGEDLLYEIAAFVEQNESFVDLECRDTYSDLNLVAWLPDLKFVRLKRKSHSNLAAENSLADSKEALLRCLNNHDTQETCRRDAVARENARLSQPERAAKEATEEQKQQEYEERRAQLLEDHKTKMAAAATGAAKLAFRPTTR